MVSRETVERLLDESVAAFGDARVQTHVPVLAERFARDRLHAMAQAEGSLVKSVPESCSGASITPVGARWPPGCSTTTHKAASTSGCREHAGRPDQP
jgi:hypothetical protein